MRIHCLLLLFLAGAAFAAKPSADVAVTSYLTDFDINNVAYYLQSDGAGAYVNGTDNVISILVANGYNHITWGD